MPERTKEQMLDIILEGGWTITRGTTEHGSAIQCGHRPRASSVGTSSPVKLGWPPYSASSTRSKS